MTAFAHAHPLPDGRRFEHVHPESPDHRANHAANSLADAHPDMAGVERFPEPGSQLPVHHAGVEIRVTTDKGTLIHTDCEHARISAIYGDADTLDTLNRGPWSQDGWSTCLTIPDAGGGWLAFQVRARPGFRTALYPEDSHREQADQLVGQEEALRTYRALGAMLAAIEPYANRGHGDNLASSLDLPPNMVGLVAELRAARAVIEPTRAYQKLTEEERAFEPSADALLWHEDLVAALAAYDKVTGSTAPGRPKTLRADLPQVLDEATFPGRRGR